MSDPGIGPKQAISARSATALLVLLLLLSSTKELQQ